MKLETAFPSLEEVEFSHHAAGRKAHSESPVGKEFKAGGRNETIKNQERKGRDRARIREIEKGAAGREQSILDTFWAPEKAW